MNEPTAPQQAHPALNAVMMELQEARFIYAICSAPKQSDPHRKRALRAQLKTELLTLADALAEAVKEVNKTIRSFEREQDCYARNRETTNDRR